MSEEKEAYRVDFQDNILTLTFDRPPGNSIPTQAVPKLTELVENINKRPEVRAVLIRGEGPNFSVGGDVKGFHEQLTTQPMDAITADFDARLGRLAKYVAAFVRIEAPIVTACQGGSAGAGLMYVLGADVVIADESAFFLFAHQRIGLTPDGGVSYLLPRVVGARRATELVITAAKVDVAEAHRIGIVSRIVPADQREAEARKQAQRFAQAPQGALRRGKSLMAGSLDLSMEDQLQSERRNIVASVADPDFAEGVTAFMEKRAARFPSTR
ncbi:MAG: enoyl-CoA hydratase-related protein [Caulobacterales bacterium]